MHCVMLHVFLWMKYRYGNPTVYYLLLATPRRRMKTHTQSHWVLRVVETLLSRPYSLLNPSVLWLISERYTNICPDCTAYLNYFENSYHSVPEMCCIKYYCLYFHQFLIWQLVLLRWCYLASSNCLGQCKLRIVQKYMCPCCQSVVLIKMPINDHTRWQK